MRRAFAVAALVPLLAACGARQSDNLDGGAAAVSDPGSSRVEIHVSSGQKLIFVATGAFDYKRDVGQFELRLFEDQSGEPAPDVFRLIGRTMYTGWTLAGKRAWQKEESFDPTDAEELIVPFEGGPTPDRVLGLLRKTSTKTENLGSDDVRGVSARHHRFNVDEDVLLAKFGIENGLDGHVDSTLVVEAWADENDLVRRLVFPESNEDDALDRATYDFFDFGVEVDVAAPPADQILSDEAFYKLFEQDCKARPAKDAQKSESCSIIGEDSGTGPVETMPRTMTEPK